MEIPIVLIAVLIIFVSIGILAARRPILLKMGLRNLTRRRTQTAIVVVGLLIGTAIVSSSMVIGDSLEFIFVKDALERLDAVDELVFREETNGEYASFGFENFTGLSASLEANGSKIDGIAPLLIKRTSVENEAEDLGEGGVTIIGFNESYESGFGKFIDVDGGEVDGDLADYEALINERAAEKLEAKENGNLTIIIDPVKDDSVTITVKHIVKNEGKGNWQKGLNIFLSLDFAQAVLNESGNITNIKVSNEGGIEDGVELSGEVTAEIEGVIKANAWILVVEETKKESIDSAKEFSENVTEIFMVLGSFSIIAGVLLIMNIFVMLAEERKSSMGISRAVGMKRGHLLQTFLFEGLFYSIIAAVLGTLFGVLLGYIIIVSFGVIFADIAQGIALTFHFETTSLVLAFSLGLIITFATIAVASWNVSKLNIVRAIRNIPEPTKERATRKTALLGVLMIVAGAVLTAKAVEVNTPLNTWVFAGPGLLILGATVLLYKVVSARAAFTLGSIILIVYVLFPRGTTAGEPSDIQMFIVIGVLLVLGAILIVMFNSDQILRPFFASKKRGRPVLKIATSYPMRKKFRTGMTLAIFALTIFTVTVISMMSHLQERSVLEETERQTGGFDILGTANEDELNLTEKLPNKENLNHDDFLFYARAPVVYVDVKKVGELEGMNTRLFGFSDELMDNNDYTFKEWANNYTDIDGVHAIRSDRDVWEALKSNESLVAVDGSATMSYYYETFGARLRVSPGEVLEVQGIPGIIDNYNLTVIAIMDQSIPQTWGIVGSERLIETKYPSQYPGRFNSYFFKLREGVDGFEISQEIEKAFFEYEMDTTYLPDVVQTILDIQRSVMLLLQSYLGLGLLVGIAALGIITVRSVVERKMEIGTLRAIGFKSRMISRAFLLEISFIAILGIVIGISLGLALSYDMYLTYFSARTSFSIPWLNILAIAAIAYIATLLATSSPARRAAKIPPADAIRPIE
jgi:putative ABC transport system permease protein